MSPKAPIILFAINSTEGGLQLLVEPGWRLMVQKRDVEYLESLFKDFLQRARSRPDALFAQLCDLGVGPLITIKAGSSLAEYPSLEKLSASFTQL